MDIQSHVQELNANRIKAHKALNDHLDAAIKAHPGQPSSVEELVIEDRINADIDGIEQEITRFVDREARESEQAVIREAQAGMFTPAPAAQATSEVDRFAAWARGTGPGNSASENGRQGAGYAFNLANGARTIEAIRDGASPADLRNAIWTTVGSGSLLMPTELDSTIYQFLTASVAMMRMPTRKINSTGGNPIDFPTVVTHGIGTQVGEGTAIGGTDAVFGKMTLNSFKYGQLVKLSTETIDDDGVDILGFVAGNVARAVGEIVATALVTGGGSGAPNGIETVVTNANAPTGGTIGGLVGGLTYDNLVDLVYSVNDNYRSRPSAAWLMRDKTAGSVRKLRDGAGGTIGAVLWEPSLTAGIQGGQPDRLLGFPVYTDPNVASIASTKKVAFFGDWDSYFVRTVGGFRFERSDEFSFNTDESTFRGLLRVDGDSADANAINAIRTL